MYQLDTYTCKVHVTIGGNSLINPGYSFTVGKKGWNFVWREWVLWVVIPYSLRNTCL